MKRAHDGRTSSHNKRNTTPAPQSQPAPGPSQSHHVSGPSPGRSKTPIQTSHDFWLQCIKDWYPDRDKKTYFLPPHFFRRTHHEVETMSGLSVLVRKPAPKVPAGSAPSYPSLTSQTQSSQAHSSMNLPISSQSNQIQLNQIQQTPPVAGSVFTLPQGDPAPLSHCIETDVLDDDATERLLRCLRVLSEENREVMMVISKLEFRKYLDNNTDPINAAKNKAACANLPRSVTMPQQQHHDGDFDVLIIHRHYGLIVYEVKAVGADRRNTPNLNKAVVKRVIKALKQLNKAKTVLNHLVSDMVPVQVTTILVLPNVTSAELMQALSTARNLTKDECKYLGAKDLPEAIIKCLDAKDLPEAITRCLCKEHIPSNADLQSLSNQGNSPDQTNEPTSGASTSSSQTSSSPGQTNQPTSGASTSSSQTSSSPGQTNQPTSGASTSSSQTSSSPRQTNQPTSGASTSSSQTSSSPTFPLLSSWWQNMTSQGAGPDPHMSDTVYDQLLARFCGPATTVEVPTVTAPRKAMAKPGKYTPASKVVRTEGEAVAETGLIHSLLALYPDQVDLLSDNTLRRVHLRGPPGTGKTIVLVLKAIQWLHQGHDVHVVSDELESRAVSILIEQQLQCVLGPNPAPGFGTVHRHNVVGVYYYTDFVNKLAALASDGELYVIADEVYSLMISSGFEDFITKLHTKIPSLSVWCASVHKLTRSPSWMCERQLTTPLRCPPTVTKEVAKSKAMTQSGIPSYSSTPAPAATEGPPVRWLPHKGGQDGHSKGSAMQCDVCGDAVVQLLKELGVGQSSGSDPLQYRDVLLLAPESKTEKNSTEGIIFKLRDNGVQVQVLTEGSKDGAVCDVALALKDEITVADPLIVSGLERRVVIATGSGKDDKYSNNRLLAMSRSTSLLVWIGDRPGK